MIWIIFLSFIVISFSRISELFQEPSNRGQPFVLLVDRRNLVANYFHLLLMHYQGCCLFAMRSLL